MGNTLITIDEKKLNSLERLNIGKGVSEDHERTLILPVTKVDSTLNEIESESEPTPNEKIAGKVVLLNKSIKSKNNKSSWMGNKKESIIAQEESSGKTKMLKLDIEKNKKK